MEDFESGSLYRWKVFKDADSSVEVTINSPGQAGNFALKVSYSLSPNGWGGVERKYTSPQDWSGYASIKFWLFGKNTGNPIRFELLDNRAAGGSGDTSERFETQFVDDFTGWKDFNLLLSAFQRRGDWQPAGAPDDGLGLHEVWGYNFAPVSGSGEFLVDQVRLEK